MIPAMQTRSRVVAEEEKRNEMRSQTAEARGPYKPRNPDAHLPPATTTNAPSVTPRRTKPVSTPRARHRAHHPTAAALSVEPHHPPNPRPHLPHRFTLSVTPPAALPVQPHQSLQTSIPRVATDHTHLALHPARSTPRSMAARGGPGVADTIWPIFNESTK